MEDRMAVLKHLAKLNIPGGGQVVAEGDHAYIGHMGPPDGTSIVDVSDRASRGSPRGSKSRASCIRTRCGCMAM
jgi:hypothetical protein